MVINIGNFFSSNNKNTSIGDFQDLEHIDGVAISSLSANLYNEKRDDLVLFYFHPELFLQLTGHQNVFRYLFFLMLHAQAQMLWARYL